jgi:hypothetical protein
MSRRPLFDKAMTPAERQRRRRQRLELSKPHKWRTMTESMHRELTWKLLQDAGIVPVDRPIPAPKPEPE